jgi:hypothetical protein
MPLLRNILHCAEVRFGSKAASQQFSSPAAAFGQKRPFQRQSRRNGLAGFYELHKDGIKHIGVIGPAGTDALCFDVLANNPGICAPYAIREDANTMLKKYVLEPQPMLSVVDVILVRSKFGQT